ncbi:hypothetical protein GCM10011579_039660 [Streptomyces albiflavescens]|uniref:Lipoprotein n=1 Tax=Streptomyces albiflavescens TaxID=1623582 RepID=A0A917Y5W9_9ACTN|nr:hypothetical protein [Streptomyces albiflavescens]GGN67280.1 hypothetical protein GCM10011579_039660 [Streptomyces albiflavescens]
MTEVPRPRAALRRTTALCLAAAVAAALATGCTKNANAKEPSAVRSSGAEVSAAPGASGRADSPSVTATPSPSRTEKIDYTDPEMVAAAFVNAYTRHSWQDPSQLSYLDRSKPYSTARYLKELRDSTSDQCGTACRQEQKKHLVVGADDIQTVIPDEAPRTAAQVWVQVSYTEHISWAGGGDSASAGMVVVLAKADGKWLVDGRQGG